MVHHLHSITFVAIPLGKSLRPQDESSNADIEGQLDVVTICCENFTELDMLSFVNRIADRIWRRGILVFRSKGPKYFRSVQS